MTEKILAELASQPWSNFEVAGGTAEHVPKAIRGLLSINAQARKDAYWQLDNELVCQSDLYEAAYFAVPYLVALLNERPEYGSVEIYDLLFEIANGSAPDNKQCRKDNGRMVSLRQGCLEEVVAGVDVYEKDVMKGSPEVRKRAQMLLELLTSQTNSST